MALQAGNRQRPRETQRIAKDMSEYGVAGKVNYEALRFAIQTYYAFIMKLSAVEVVFLYGGGGSIFEGFGYENFPEGDYLSWYHGEWIRNL